MADIKYKIKSLKETMFSLNHENLPTLGKVAPLVQLGMQVNKVSETELSLSLHINLACEQSTLLAYGCEHIFEIENMTSIFNFKEEGLEDKHGFLPTLFDISYNGIRGMIAIRVLGTKLSDYPLPLLSPKEVFKDMSKK